VKKLLKHKSIIIATLLALIILVIQLTTAQQPAHATTLDGFPVFQYQGIAIDPDALNYNPTDEIIFPSIIKANDYFSNPLAAYYLYYAPHDKPGGINLAYSDSLDGPWTEYAHNPIISNEWAPYYAVSHVSGPHAIWIESEEELYLYFHGENSVTRLARSIDGIEFTYDSSVVSIADFDSITEASYARVFEYTIPSKNNKYIMLLMGNNGGSRKIYLAWSNDGKQWTTRREPLISPTADEGDNIAGPYFYPWNGKNYVIHHNSDGTLYITEVGANFDQEMHLGMFYQDPDGVRAASPYFFSEGDVQYLFHVRGSRSYTNIAIAKYDPNAPIPVNLPGETSSNPVQAGLLLSTILIASLLGGKQAFSIVRSPKITSIMPAIRFNDRAGSLISG